MITYVQGGFFASPAQALVNPVNTVGMMGRGLAREFRVSFPAMYREYQRHCRNKDLAPGVIHLHRSLGKIVLNLPTKRHWKPASRIEDIEEGLRTFVDRLDELEIRSVSFPQLGCGTGGLDWEQDVRPLMERYLDPISIVAYVHIQEPGDAETLLDLALGLGDRPVCLSRQRIAQDIGAVVESASTGFVNQLIDVFAFGGYASRLTLHGFEPGRIAPQLTAISNLPYMRRTSVYERPCLTRRVGALNLDPRFVVEGSSPSLAVEDALLCPRVHLAMPLAI